MKGKTTVPKEALTNLIMSNFDEEVIRQELKIKRDTNLSTRLRSYNKIQLVELITSSAEGRELLSNLEGKFPLPDSPTLYLTISRKVPSFEQIVNRTYETAENHECVLTFSSKKSIKRVYNTETARILNIGPDFIEIPLFYERRIEYTSSEEESWGEIFTIYDLRRAFIWLSKSFNHGLIACCDYSAINPILTWANTYLQIQLDLPNIDIKLFNKLAEGGNPRTATFSATELAVQPYLDIQAVTIYDQQLADKPVFQQLKKDEDNEQTAGFYSQHPSISVGGLGISRRYGRIWTPVHLPKQELLRSAVNLIRRTESALDEKIARADKSYIKYFDNLKFEIDGKKLSTKGRTIFNDIAWSLIQLHKRQIREEVVDNSLIERIIESKDELGFTTTIQSGCKNCGAVLLKCPECSSPYEVVVRNGEIIVSCPVHGENALIADDEFRCECGEKVRILLPNDIKTFPRYSTIIALRDLISQRDLSFDGWFLFDGNLLKTFSKKQVQVTEYHLHDLTKWLVRAHIHKIGPVQGKRENRIIRILGDIKEKCNVNNWHVDESVCMECFDKHITIKDLNKSNMCLPRLLGIAIDEKFDGIHFGAELADVKYHDRINNNNQEVYIGIHLKSREINKPKRGVGQASIGIKGLYAQTFFTVYQSLNNRPIFDIVGISIPNKIYSETKNAIVKLTTELGLPILVLDEDDWKKITAVVIEKIENY